MNRGLNIHNANTNLISTADLCGQRILGMSGSLTNWINTGNAGTLDSFRKTNYAELKKEKRRKKFLNALKLSIVALGLTAAGVLIFKNKTKISQFCKTTINKFKSKFQASSNNADKGFLGTLKDKIKNLFKNRKVLNDSVSASNPIIKTSDSIVDEVVSNQPKASDAIVDKMPEVKSLETSKVSVLPSLNPPEERLLLEAPKEQETLIIVPKRKAKEPLITPRVIELGPSNEKTSEVLSDTELEDIKVLCGYDTAKNINVDNFEADFKQAKEVIDLSSYEVARLADKQDECVHAAQNEEARELAKKLQEDYRAILNQQSYTLPDEAFDFAAGAELKKGQIIRFYDPQTNEVYGAPYLVGKSGNLTPLVGEDMPTTGKRIIIKSKQDELPPIKCVEPLDKVFMDEARALCKNAPLIEISEEELINGAKPKFDFANWAKKRKSRPELQRYRAEYMNERLEDAQHMIKVPKRPKK